MRLFRVRSPPGYILQPLQHLADIPLEYCLHPSAYQHCDGATPPALWQSLSPEPVVPLPPPKAFLVRTEGRDEHHMRQSDRENLCYYSFHEILQRGLYNFQLCFCKLVHCQVFVLILQCFFNYHYPS